ncbi:hypothetical protein BATDEDRAFT_87247 [Batrachochytrium dendrobatidis JAM81]|uniref:Cyclic nucleotide-binding domain-containing protein n=1 Tax=Batrachochytrium dendrobatidis (strain JAM81 / FGSC 10211) TaxID=684364 RepID=F4NYY2_BATDJ|nr:uncharacterized protein BATDEDRAFT_87247 [Batrachochytrium dendrobatidis JAM81]EGF81789.1 hypothetical protein BATDEDRAFT_87247 [Batrachochytrium dendrobatidis JAM81]|eukprot:XP_006677530.1 hypothetical protein BATDEDRAFT_87247 [Batrachochytrium dendrobatidis JAM81]
MQCTPISTKLVALSETHVAPSLTELDLLENTPQFEELKKSSYIPQYHHHTLDLIQPTPHHPIERENCLPMPLTLNENHSQPGKFNEASDSKEDWPINHALQNPNMPHSAVKSSSNSPSYSRSKLLEPVIISPRSSCSTSPKSKKSPLMMPLSSAQKSPKPNNAYLGMNSPIQGQSPSYSDSKSKSHKVPKLPSLYYLTHNLVQQPENSADSRSPTSQFKPYSAHLFEQVDKPMEDCVTLVESESSVKIGSTTLLPSILLATPSKESHILLATDSPNTVVPSSLQLQPDSTLRSLTTKRLAMLNLSSFQKPLSMTERASPWIAAKHDSFQTGERIPSAHEPVKSKSIKDHAHVSAMPMSKIHLSENHEDQDILNDCSIKNKKEVAEALHRPIRQFNVDVVAKMHAKQVAQRIKTAFLVNNSKLQNRVERNVGISKMGRVWVCQKWRLALASTLLGIRMTSEFKNIAKGIQEIQRIPCTNENSLLYILQTYQGHADTHLSAKIKAVCFSKVRSFESLEQLSKLLSLRLQSFAQFSTNNRLQFCRIMQYAQFPVGSLIIKEGHISSSYYIIVSGQVELFIVRDGFRYRLNVLNPGDSFGRLMIREDINTSSVATLMDSEFIYIDKDESSKISVIGDWKHLLVELSKVPHFNMLDTFLSSASGLISVLTFEPNEIIFPEGTDHKMIYWVISGQCSCHKAVPFIQHRVKISASNTKIQFLPCDPNAMTLTQQQLDDGDEIVFNQLSIHDLTSGEHFPDLPFSEEYQWVTTEMFDQHDYAKHLEDQVQSHGFGKTFISVVSSSKVIVASMTCLDYVRLASEKMILDLLRHRMLQTFSISELQKAFIEKRKWEAYKKNLVRDLRK